MPEGITPNDFAEGVSIELQQELRDHCIIYKKGEEHGQIPIGFEMTDRAMFLMGMLAMATEIAARQSGDSDV